LKIFPAIFRPTNAVHPPKEKRRIDEEGEAIRHKTMEKVPPSLIRSLFSIVSARAKGDLPEQKEKNRVRSINSVL